MRAGFGDKLDFLSRSRLRREADICGAKYADDGIATSHGVISQKYRQPTTRRHLQRTLDYPFARQLRVDRSRQNGPIEPCPDPVGMCRRGPGGGLQHVNGVIAKPVVSRTENDSQPEGGGMTVDDGRLFEPGKCLHLGADGQRVASLDDRGPDTGQHVSRAGSEYLRHGDATPDGQVGAHPRGRRADGEDVATFEDEYGVSAPPADH